jgi:hypothetical protein
MLVVSKSIQGLECGTKVRGRCGHTSDTGQWRPGQSIDDDDLQNRARSRRALQERGMMMVIMGERDSEKREVKVRTMF